MIARRKLLIGLTWGALIARFTANGRVPAAAAQRNTGQRDNCSFVADLQASLQRGGVFATEVATNELVLYEA